MTVKDRAAEVNGRHLYRKRDGSAVEANQVHARLNNYGQLFEKEGPRVRPLHQFKTSEAPKHGAYWAGVTEVRHPDGGVMHVGARVAYHSRPATREGETPDEYAQRLSASRAVALLAKGRFADGVEDVALLTSFGWQPVGGALEDEGGPPGG